MYLPQLPTAAFKIFLFIMGFEQLDYNVLWCGFLYVYSAWVLLSFLYHAFIVFVQFEKRLAIITYTFLLFLPFIWDTDYMPIRLLVLSHRSLCSLNYWDISNWERTIEISDYNFYFSLFLSSLCLRYSEVLLLDAYMFIIAMSPWWTDLFILMKQPSFPIVISWTLKFTQCEINISIPVFFYLVSA